MYKNLKCVIELGVGWKVLVAMLPGAKGEAIFANLQTEIKQ